jgi:peptidoglycan/LPS O-acetylase OafA/YrhL
VGLLLFAACFFVGAVPRTFLLRYIQINTTSVLAWRTLAEAQSNAAMGSSYEKFRGVRFFGSLNGLRALSIVAVIWLHARWETPYYTRLEAMPVLRQGFYGVQVFFVVSGFLITTLLLREMERYGKISLRDFYIRRALRIWPLYDAVLGIYVVDALVFERGTVRATSFLHYLPTFATFTYTWFISANWPGGMFNLAWTLSTEEQFYFFWPIVLRFLRGVGPRCF